MATIFVTNTADSGAGSLREAIAIAQPGDTIAFNLAANSTINLTSGQIDIPVGKNLIIDGTGAPNLTISGSNVSRIFAVNANVVTATSVTIRNLTLSNAYTPQQGAAIVTTDEVTLVIDNVTFSNNVADRGGGAVFANWNSDVFVANSRFFSNVAIAGNDERGAGAIAFVSPGILQVTNSDFIGNRGINGAAINSLNGKLTIENSRFINNDTTAAFFDTGNPNPFLRGYGGAVYTDRASSTSETSGTIRISSSVFEGNRGRGEGGAAYLFTAAGQDNVILENSLFRNNQVIPLPGGNGGNGGALVQISNGLNLGFTVINTTFADNSATAQGGGLWVFDAPTSIFNSTISGNRAGNTATPNAPSDNFGNVGGGLTIYSPATIINTTFANNVAEWVGGGLSVGNNAPVTLQNTIFASNRSLNRFQILQQVNEAPNLIDGGGNLQFPARLTNFFNDRDLFPTVTIADPLLSPLQFVGSALVHVPAPGSPAIDTGVATSLGADQTGAPRPQDGDFNGTNLTDIGAVEVPGTPIAEITLLDGATNILDGTTTPLNLGTVLVGDLLARSFTLANTGTAALTLSGLTLPTGFSLVGALPAALAPGASIPLVIQVDTAIAGTFAGSFSLINSDSDENPFDFAIQAIVQTPLPEIVVQEGGINILDGSTTPINFGTTLLGGTLSRTFTITNTGTAALSLLPLTLPTGFTLGAALPNTLAAGASTALVIGVDTAVAGNFSGSLVLTNSDADENPFDFALQATVRAANTAPTVTAPLLDQNATATTPFQYTIAPNTFADLDNDPLALTATLSGGLPLPAWLTFDPVSLTFSGTPGAGDVGTLLIDLTAADGLGGSVADTFAVAIAPAPILPIVGTDESETLVGTASGDRIFGLGGHDTLSGSLGDDELWGGIGNDRLDGQEGNDQLYGEAGNDQLFGGDGNNLLAGGEGDDLLYGGNGSDRLIGGEGNDILTGNGGADIFILAAGAGTDIIRDFRLGEDQIGLAAGLSLGQLTITQRNSQTWIRNSTTAELLARLDGVNAANLIAQAGTTFVPV
ncbi:MAG: choice-of-anchor D domain-containing protein [Leptolyngbyaceae cyanobacterium bins.349]|nr:choice-of-anchor D domain-containing protein [Leptolyngbyaceae cyanobacterium bins.349]